MTTKLDDLKRQMANLVAELVGNAPEPKMRQFFDLETAIAEEEKNQNVV